MKRIQFHHHWPYLGWDDVDAEIDIKIFPNISIEIFNISFEEKPEIIWFIRLEWLIFSITIHPYKL